MVNTVANNSNVHASTLAVFLLMAPTLLLIAPGLLVDESWAQIVPASPTLWLKYANNPVLDIGTPGTFDSKTIQSMSIAKSGTRYFLYYNGDSGSGNKVGLATSSDGKSFTKHAGNPIISDGASPSVIRDGQAFKMWYIGEGGVRHATSSDGMVWTNHPGNPVLINGTPQDWDVAFWSVNVIRDGDIYKMWYSAGTDQDLRIGYATSADGIAWTRYSKNPVLVQEDSWETVRVHSPCVLRASGEYQMWYSGNGTQATSICFANSSDGIDWQKSPANPLMPASAPWETSSKLFPLVLYDGRDYRMWYTGIDASRHTRIGYAESTTIGPRTPEPLSPPDNEWTSRSSPEFGWKFGPAQDADWQSAFQLQLEDSLDFASELVDTGKVSSSNQSFNISTPLPDGTYYWRVRAWDGSGLESPWSDIRTAKIDTAAPAINGFSINDGAAFTNKTTVRCHLNASDPSPGSGLAMMRHSNDGMAWTPWEPYKTDFNLELSGSDRKWTVSVEVRDRLDNSGERANASILVDTMAPSQTGLRINDGAAFTNKLTVALTIVASDIEPATGLSDMAFSNDGVIWSTWEPFSPNRAYNISAGEGAKVIRVKFRDNAQNIGGWANASIFLDTNVPVASISPMPVLSEETNFTVGWTGQDSQSGVGSFDVDFQEKGGAWTGWLRGTNLTKATFSANDESSYSFRARATDTAGNTGAFPDTVSNVIRVNVPRPTVAILEPAASRTLHGKLLAAGTAGHPKPLKAVTLVETSIDGGPWAPATGTLSWGSQIDTTKLKNGWHNISARSFDGVKYSAVATTDFKILNKPDSPKTTSIPLVFPLVIIVVTIVVVAILLLLRRGQPPARAPAENPEKPPPY